MTIHGTDTIRNYVSQRDTRRNGRLNFTIEQGRGETYISGEWTLYAHDRYERSSVLHGRERRTWIECFGPDQAGLDAAKAACEAAGIKADVLGGSSFQHDAMLDISNGADDGQWHDDY
jgi:hypothetical protein